jgi:hypothetical protein
MCSDSGEGLRARHKIAPLQANGEFADSARQNMVTTVRSLGCCIARKVSEQVEERRAQPM